MKKLILFSILGAFILISTKTVADCFILKENNQIIQQDGDCESRHSPCSTFKIAISLMAYNDELLINETQPELPFKNGYPDYIEKWKQPHNPSLWMKNSCVWYSQVLTQSLGMNKFKEYITKFNYGNQDIVGDKGKNNGLTHSWLSSSLEISPGEQMEFLQNLLHNKLPITLNAHQMTRNILFVEDLPKGWKLYGKTGSGNLLNNDRTEKLDLQIGWFIGWIKKEERKIIFVQYLEDNDKQETYAAQRAKEAVKLRLAELIQNLDTGKDM
ncbi:MAG: class D beta-lactamase [Candidatus Caenarcaniphilales bacterium]|nr:class D beta-lactamase [Candidatus Caenarcaniphilales bacterium]